MKRVKRIAAISIVCFWLIMMGLLVKKHFFVSPSLSLEKEYFAPTLETREEWAGLYLKNEKIGYAHSQITRVEDGFQISEDLVMDMSIMGMPQKVESRINANTARDLTLKDFNFRIKSGVVSFIAYGNVEGSDLKLLIFSGGKRTTRIFKLHDVPVLSNTLKFYVLKNGLAAGTKLTRNFFDPLTMSNRTINIEVEDTEEISIKGQTHRCYRIKETFQGVVLYAWVNDQGETLKEESPMGIVMIKETQQEALTAGSGQRVDILAATAVTPDKPLPEKGLSFLRVRLKNITPGGFSLEGGRQRRYEDIVEIRSEGPIQQGAYAVPYGKKDMNIFLAATPFIQSTAEEIVHLAAEIRGAETDAHRVARMLSKWVYENIEKRPTLSLPSAVEVLRTRQGDCNEHAVLLAALCRAAGIPTKLCAGIVYMKGSFYYHAWVEVFIHQWISVDPTLGQFPSDVTHIRFIEGDLENQLSVLRIVGKLGIEILEHS